MTKETIIKKLVSKGNTKVRAEQIVEEAEKSSNPSYVLNYFGIKCSTIL